MTEIVINDLDPYDAYTAAGGETGFDYTFPIFDQNNLVVLEIDTDDTVTPLTSVTDYTVSGVGVATGGSITLDPTLYPSGATADYRYVLYRDLAIARTTDFLNGGDFKAATVNLELDKIIMMLQQNERDTKRRLGLQFSDPEDEIQFELSTAALRADKLLVFGSNGNTVKGVTPSSISLSGLDTLLGTLAADDFIVYNGTNWVNKTTAEIKTALGLAQNNYAATTAPGVGDDSDDGYSIGSQWYDGTNDNMYHCLDATVGAAVWVQGDIVAADLGSAATKNLIDDDTFATATSTNIPSAESVKAYVDNRVTNRAYAEYATNTDLTTQIPDDDTLPQNTEGTQILTAAITPTLSTSRIRATFSGFWSGNASVANAAAAMFVNSGADAVQVVYDWNDTTGQPQLFYMQYEFAPGTTDEQTINIRVGPDGGTMRMNGTTSARLGGGAAKSTLILEEVFV